jgi:hypothetical protein
LDEIDRVAVWFVRPHCIFSHNLLLRKINQPSTMNSWWKKAILLLSAACLAQAQPNDNDFTYFNEPDVAWTNFTSDDFEGPREGNGLYMSPDGRLLVSTSVDATIRAFHPETGDVLWTYKPNSLGFPIRCFGGVTFNLQASRPYLVFSIADAAVDKDNSPIAET